jgi:RHS repeat-associated protein
MSLLAQQNPDGTWSYPVTDGLGSIRGVTNATGDPLESRILSSFGELTSQTGTTQTPFGFTGEPTDQNGLVYMRSRHYNPLLGTFPQLDSYEGMISDPLSLNRYSYVNGNPVNRVDPTGMIAEDPRIWDTCVADQNSNCEAECRREAHLFAPPGLMWQVYQACLLNCANEVIPNPLEQFVFSTYSQSSKHKAINGIWYDTTTS